MTKNLGKGNLETGSLPFSATLVGCRSMFRDSEDLSFGGTIGSIHALRSTGEYRL